MSHIKVQRPSSLPEQISGSSSTKSSSVDHLNEEGIKIESTEMMPLVCARSDKAFLATLPGVVGSASSSSGHSNKRSKETSIIYSNLGGKVPGMNHRVKGMQSIRVQATLQDPDALNTSTTTPTYFAQYFTLGQIANSAAYTALFDEYKIDEVEVWINPNPVTSLGASTIRGQYSTAVDYDDANTPSSISTVSDKQNSLTSSVDDAHYHRFQPKFAVGAYSGTFVSFASSRGWVDCASPNVQHYGLKMAFSQTAAGVQFVSLVIRYTISFRSPGIS
jgi:hypothetical protein